MEKNLPHREAGQVIGHLQVRDISIPAGVGSYFDAGAGAGGAIVPIYTYTLDDANRATITGYSGNATALYIPGEIGRGMRLLQSEIGHLRTGRI